MPISVSEARRVPTNYRSTLYQQVQQCCVRVQVVKSESSPQSPSPSPSHHLRVRVKKKLESESRIYLPKHENKQQNVSNVRVNSATRHGRYCLDSGPSHESQFLSPCPSPSQSEKHWTRVRVRVKWTRVRVPTRVTQHCLPV